MNLVEVMVAAAVFAAATGSSVQLWASAASSSQRTDLQQQLLERMELDRLQLQAHWRRELLATSRCGELAAALQASATAVMPPPQLQRSLIPAAVGDGVQVVWHALEVPALQRQRQFTAAGLGLCAPEPPLTDSQLEGGP